MKQYYVFKDGNQQGPIPLSQLELMVASGKIGRGDLCWAEGMANWQPIQNVVLSTGTVEAVGTTIVRNSSPEVKEARKHIKNACVAGIISGVLTLIIILISVGSGKAIAGLDAWGLIDVLLVFGLTYGIYRKSRVCAVVMFAYFIISKLIMWAEIGKPTGLVMALIFGYYYFRGMQGTITYHKLIKREG